MTRAARTIGPVDLLPVARQMAAGATDEAGARALGMSLRTYRDRCARVLNALGAESRFQAGVLAERAGWFAAQPARAVPR